MTKSAGAAGSGSSRDMRDMKDSDPRRIRWILIVEDDHALNKAVADQLIAAGFRTVPAFKISEAVAKLSNQKFDCVLLDLKFDYKSGEQIVDIMRGGDPNPNRDTPIVIMSGFVDPDTVRKLGKLVNGFLVKPFDQKILMEKLNSVLSAPAARMEK